MFWPQSQDYNEAIQNQATSFGDSELRHGEAVTNASGLPLPRSGNFADVYEFRGASGQRWAIKCFTRQVPRLQERYGEISKYLAAANLPFTVDFTYLPKGIRVGSDFFPILKMKWVDGQLLNEVVRNQLDKPAWLEKLVQIWARMAERLHEAGIAHADLQHANVILVPGSRENAVALKLIDYDGMFIPTLKKVKSGESGHPAYQHPERIKQDIYDAHVDRLPVLAIACAMRSLAAGGKALWNKYDNGDNMLFREADLCKPASSPLFHELWRMDDPATHHLTGHLAAGLASALHYVPLLSSLLHGDEVRPLSPSEKTRVEAILGVAKVAQCTVPAKVPVATKKSHTPPPSSSIKTVKMAPAAADWSVIVDDKSMPQPSRRRRGRHSILMWLLIAVLLGIVAGGAAALALMNDDNGTSQAHAISAPPKVLHHPESPPKLDSAWDFEADHKEKKDARAVQPPAQEAQDEDSPAEESPPGPKSGAEASPAKAKDAEPPHGGKAAPDVKTSETPKTDAESASKPDTGLPTPNKSQPKTEPKTTTPSDPPKQAGERPKIAPAPAVEAERKPRPAQKRIDESIKQLHLNRRDEFEKIRDAAERLALAARLLDDGREIAGMNKDAYQYACLIEARDWAAKGIDFELGFEAVSELTAAFEVNAAKLKAEMIDIGRGQAPHTPMQHAALAQAALTVMVEIMEADAYEYLGGIPGMADYAAKKSNDPSLKKEVKSMGAKLKRLKDEYEKIKRSIARLKTHPDDGEANLKVGRFLVFEKEFWGQGVRLLAKGSDAKLAALASREVPVLDERAGATPKNGAQTDPGSALKALADAWRNFAKEITVSGEKEVVLRHANYWDHIAQRILEGTPTEDAEKRLKQN